MTLSSGLPPEAEAFDVVVLGAGAGGMAAAAVAATEGLSVLVLEKTRHVGGTTAISGGMVWAPNCDVEAAADDSTDAAAAYLDATVPTDAGRAIREAYLAAAPLAIGYLAHHTEVRLEAVPFYPDYYPELPGATTRGRVLEPEPFDGRRLGDAFDRLKPPLPEFTLFGGMMVARADLPHFRNLFRSARSALHVARLVVAYARQRLGHRRGTSLVLGNALAGRLLKSLLDRDVSICLDTHVVRLERQAGRVVGVVVAEQGRERVLVAKRAVILATGGFSHNAARRRDLLPREAQEVTAVADGAAGDGLDLGTAAGGRIERAEFSPAFWVPASHYRRSDGRQVIFPHTVTDRGKPGLIAVTAAGRRFTNEAASYHEFVGAMLRADNAADAVPARLICDRRFIWKYGLGAIKPMTLRLRSYKAAGYLTEANSIAGLARALRIDEDALVMTVERYNRDARQGTDTEFGRGSNVYQRHFGDAEVHPNPCLAPIERPPFYSISVSPADLGTATGLAVNAQAQVLDGDGRPVPRLYACGNDMASIMQGAYPGPGITIGPALVFGYLAAMHAAAAAEV
ncbi:MAG: FAD-dependent oxidoreductase [Alphaproteobacteria bacterium]|jgi:succinate dehydrogenase/fumarate reductase flavoprotein subunit|nr:FAD-dependent oxidoreductase [Alphaproteobacteria bacterium]